MSEEKEKNPIAVALGKMRKAKAKPGEYSDLGKIGGKARAASLSPERRSEIARNAVAARNAKRAAKNTEKDVDKK